MKVGKKLKELVGKYDNWCESMGLSQEQGRCCVPVRKEDYSKDNKENKKKDESGTI